MQVYNIPLDSTHMETTRHGTPDFPLAIYTTRINRNILGYIDWHWHTELQFCLVTEGIVDFYVNRSHFILSQGEGIFINTQQLHMAKNYNNIEEFIEDNTEDIKNNTFVQYITECLNNC